MSWDRVFESHEADVQILAMAAKVAKFRLYFLAGYHTVDMPLTGVPFIAPVPSEKLRVL